MTFHMRLAALCFLAVGLVPVFDALATGRAEDSVWRKRSSPLLSRSRRALATGRAEDSVWRKRSSPLLSRSRKALPVPLKIAVWNLKTFGGAKMSDPERAEHIKTTVQLYDIFGILETRDKDGDAQSELAAMVGPAYGRVESERLGTTSYKESVLVFYRLDRVEVLAELQFPISDLWFEREPYTVLFSPVGSVIPTVHVDPCAPCAAPPEAEGGVGYEFAISFFHAKPATDVTIQEINDLFYVYEDIVDTLGIQDIIIAGDLNADCSYAKPHQLEALQIYTDDLFYWPISSLADTTTATTNCAYDRFILTGNNIMSSYVGGSAKIFNYTIAYGLTYAETYDLSDHYPIELELV